MVVVATTNVAPDDLYKDGLNRALFLPFIALLKEHMAVFHLDAPRDYRLDAAGSERRYVTPLGPDADACLDAHFRRTSAEARTASRGSSSTRAGASSCRRRRAAWPAFRSMISVDDRSGRATI